MLDIHTHFNFQGLIDVSEDFSLVEKSVVFSVGIHPNKLKTISNLEDYLENIKLLVNDKKCAAIGECGLDKFAQLDLVQQEKVFLSQVEIAKQYSKPLIIHCVRLFNEVERILKRQKFSLPVVFHGFNANQVVVKHLLKSPNFYFSLSEKMLQEKNNIFKSLSLIPLEKILVESDTDQNTDFYGLIKKIAEIKQTDFQFVKSTIETNFKNIVLL